MIATVATHGSPATLLILIAVVLAVFWVASAVLWALGRVDDRSEMAAGRAARRLADGLVRDDLGEVGPATLRRLEAMRDQEADR